MNYSLYGSVPSEVEFAMQDIKGPISAIVEEIEDIVVYKHLPCSTDVLPDSVIEWYRNHLSKLKRLSSTIDDICEQYSSDVF